MRVHEGRGCHRSQTRIGGKLIGWVLFRAVTIVLHDGGRTGRCMSILLGLWWRSGVEEAEDVGGEAYRYNKRIFIVICLLLGDLEPV